MSYTTLGTDYIARNLFRHDRVHEPLASPELFGEAELRQYERVGFVAIENVFPIDMVRDAARALRQLILDGSPRQTDPPLVVQIEPAADGKPVPREQREMFVRKLMCFTRHDDRLHRMVEHEPLLRIIRLLAGADVRMFQDMALLKPPLIGAEKPWHQDAAYFTLAPMDKIVGTWTAIDEATVENGCMHVIPGSHLGGAKPHVHDRDCQLPDEDVDVTNNVAVPLGAGGTLFFSGLLHHGTPPNRSPLRRQALQFHYASVQCQKIEHAAHGEKFNDGDRYAGCVGAAPKVAGGGAPT